MNPNDFTNVVEGAYADGTDLINLFGRYKQQISGKFPAIVKDFHFVLVIDNERNYYFATYKVKK